MRKIILALLLSASLAHAACDTKGVGFNLPITVAAQSTWTEVFDFSDCQVGLRNSHFYLIFKGKGITAELFDLTTGVSYGPGIKSQNALVWNCVNNCESIKGHVLELRIRNETRKAINTEVQRSVCYCGP